MTWRDVGFDFAQPTGGLNDPTLGSAEGWFRSTSRRDTVINAEQSTQTLNQKFF